MMSLKSIVSLLQFVLGRVGFKNNNRNAFVSTASIKAIVLKLLNYDMAEILPQVIP
ncbi:hypothetical protein MTBPR1_150015 [Candidatus Terasakiella magnetica]|uniref:Uncharacterized protein n=1 Tax=Candidatus Terasakiella magnetica TaxID=1867952 RepID=A0A1C3RFC8_9PROT|nr:hypothetical protein MTBPR1_150015 [Candidatus Terasakiella magnetica]